MSFTFEQNASSSMAESQESLTQALEPYITEWPNSLTKDEIDLVARLADSEAAEMFAIWVSEKATFYGMLLKEEWQRRLVAEANAREAESDLKQAEEDLKRTEQELHLVKLALERATRKELKKESRFLRRVVGGIGREHASESDTDAV